MDKVYLTNQISVYKWDEYDSVRSTTSKSFGDIPKGRVAERVQPRTPPLHQILKKVPSLSLQITAKWNQRQRINSLTNPTLINLFYLWK
ncbi:hypothetical protein CEXT_1651 [Caerostris extrusa]|uniref:Uncharacterized protein n=1 Tax=Caerostris extrusa TaxID=172846 RepID=A0AAV4Y825_CAEEX|nr:hypothetical protein CEXT_1651 [Caerostris extrusa]